MKDDELHRLLGSIVANTDNCHKGIQRVEHHLERSDSKLDAHIENHWAKVAGVLTLVLGVAGTVLALVK